MTVRDQRPYHNLRRITLCFCPSLISEGLGNQWSNIAVRLGLAFVRIQLSRDSDSAWASTGFPRVTQLRQYLTGTAALCAFQAETQ